jgi:biopolymer transport protein ExbB
MVDPLLLPVVEFVRSGGLVMVPLLVLSVWLWSVILSAAVRVFAWSSVKTTSRAQAASKKTLCRQLEKFVGSSQKMNRHLLACAIDQILRPLDSAITTIRILSAVAPLLGLLGTVNGMINTFEVLALFGTGNARALASGISEAMVTTQTGLMVAVPGIVAGYILKGKNKTIKGRLKSYGLSLLRR